MTMTWLLLLHKFRISPFFTQKNLTVVFTILSKFLIKKQDIKCIFWKIFYIHTKLPTPKNLLTVFFIRKLAVLSSVLYIHIYVCILPILSFFYSWEWQKKIRYNTIIKINGFFSHNLCSIGAQVISPHLILLNKLSSGFRWSYLGIVMNAKTG